MENTNKSSLPELLSPIEAANFLKIPKSSFYNLVKDPDFPSFRVGRNIRIPKEALMNWIDNKINSKTIT